jgi:uncharacterized OB-fold protein
MAGTTNPDLLIDDDRELVIPSTIQGRAAPVVTPESEPFWSGLTRNEVILSRCQSCHRWNYLATAGCPWCGSADVCPEAVDGEGELYSFSVCYVEYGPGMETPYVVGVISPSCEPDLRIVTNVVGCRVRDVRIGAAMSPVVVPTDFGGLLLYRPS